MAVAVPPPLEHQPADDVGDHADQEHRHDAAVLIPNAEPQAGDDDIVARQLREAAERETDPVLREKLWAEYRNYKGQ